MYPACYFNLLLRRRELEFMIEVARIRIVVYSRIYFFIGDIIIGSDRKLWKIINKVVGMKRLWKCGNVWG